MIKHRIETKLFIEEYPSCCKECPMFYTQPYTCHNERGQEAGCQFGYMANSDMRDFTGRQLFDKCKMKVDPNVIIQATKDNGKSYYEIELGNKAFSPETENDDTFSICIIAEHYPNFEETKEFIKKDMEKYGCKVIRGITPLSYEEAHEYYNMENEKDFPILK